jgi:hypothetical protein
VDAPRLVEPLVKWSHEPSRPQDAPQSLSNAIFQATAAPAGPAYLSLPLDDWDQDADASALGHLKSRVIDGNPVVSEEALGALRERLAAAQNPVMVAGPDIDTPAGWDGAVRLAAELWAVTSDPDEAARAPVGHILIGDPAEAVKRLADTIPAAGRPPLAREPLPQADTTGPAFTEEAIMDAINAAKTDSTVFAHEWATHAVKAGLSSDRPSLIEISQRRIGDS